MKVLEEDKKHLVTIHKCRICGKEDMKIIYQKLYKDDSIDSDDYIRVPLRMECPHCGYSHPL